MIRGKFALAMQFALSLSFVCSPLLDARHTFQALITDITRSETAEASATCILNLSQDIKTSALEHILPVYSPTDALSLDFNLRGLLANGLFPANSTALTITFPQIGLTQTFDGETRDDSISLFKEYLKDQATKIHGFLRAHSRLTPIDPIAGNPNSLMALMGQSDYALGRISLLSGCDECWSAQPEANQYQLGLTYGRGFSKGYDMTLISLPLRYSYSPDNNWAFILDAPITLLSTGGSYSALGSIGLGARVPITQNWSLTPTFRTGFGGSIDLGTASFFASPGIVNNLQYPISNYVIGMTNFIGYYCSGPLHLGGINFDYHLHNWVFKNGLYLTSCKGFCIYGREYNFNIFITDTDFEGNKLFIEHYDDVGISLITTDILPCVDYDVLSLGFSCQFGEKGWRGYYFNMIYQF